MEIRERGRVVLDSMTSQYIVFFGFSWKPDSEVMLTLPLREGRKYLVADFPRTALRSREMKMGVRQEQFPSACMSIAR